MFRTYTFPLCPLRVDCVSLCLSTNYNCISYLLLCNKLLKSHQARLIYFCYLIVSVDQINLGMGKSVFCRGSAWTQVARPTVFPSGDTAEEECTSKLIQVVDRIHFLVNTWMRAPESCWLLAGGHLHVLEATVVSSQVDFFIIFLSLQTCKDILWLLNCKIGTLFNLLRVTLHHLCHILLVIRKSHVPLILCGRGLYNVIHIGK